MKVIVFIAGSLFLMSCNANRNFNLQPAGVDHAWLDSIKQSGDSSYVKKYGTAKFANAAYYCNTKDSIICQVMKDNFDSVRKIIITKNGRRIFLPDITPMSS